MKNLKKYKMKIIVILLVLFCMISNVSFAENEIVANENSNSVTEEQITTENEKKDGDLYLCDDTVSIDEKVNGNVFIIAETANINTQIDGNVFILANKINISSKTYIYGTAFICSDTTTISGYINDLYSMSKTLRFGTNATIIRDAHIACEDLSLNGEFRKNLYLVADNISVNKVTTKIEGNLEYSATTEIIPEELVTGEINYKELKSDSSWKSYLKDAIYVIIVALIVTLIVILGMPKFADKEEELVKTKILRTILYGALTLILTPIICTILCFTGIGIILALVIIFVYIFIISISNYIVAIPLSKILCNKLNKNNKSINIVFSIIIALIFWLIKLIPYIGEIVFIIISIIALGIITYSIIEKIKSKKNSKNNKEEKVEQIEGK